MRRDIYTFPLVEPLGGVRRGMRVGRKIELVHKGLGCYIGATPSINDEGTNFTPL